MPSFLSRKLGITVLYVTHDQVEAMALADRMAVMSGGKVLETGVPEKLYHFSHSRPVAEFLGAMNIFHGAAENGGVKTGIGVLTCAIPEGMAGEGGGGGPPGENCGSHTAGGGGKAVPPGA